LDEILDAFWPHFVPSGAFCWSGSRFCGGDEHEPSGTSFLEIFRRYLVYLDMPKPTLGKLFRDSDGLPAWHVKWFNILTWGSVIYYWLAPRVYSGVKVSPRTAGFTPSMN